MVGRANGLKTKLLVASGVRNNLYLVAPAASPLSSIKDIRDHKVSIFRGTNGHLVAINVLAAHGLTERDIKGVNLDAGSAQAALVSNGVDAAFGGYEWFKVRDQGLAKVIYSTQGQDPRIRVRPRCWCAGSSSATTRRRCRRWSMSSCAPRAGPRTRPIATRCSSSGEKSGVPYASWAAEFDKQDLAARNSPLIDDFIIARYKAVVADALKLKLIRREVSVDGWFDDRYLKQALRTQGLEHYWTRYDAAGKCRGRAPGLRALIGDAHGRPVLFRRLARGAGAALGAPGRLDRRALAAARAAAGAMARGRQPGLDLAAGAAAAGLCLETLRDRPSTATCGSTPPPACGALLAGFAAGGLLGLLLGVAMGLSRRLEAYLLPTFNALVQIPVLAWLPFVLLLVGIGEALKIILIAKAALVPVTLNTRCRAFARPARRCARWDASMATRRQEVLEIVLPLATPTLFTGLRLGFTKAWLSLVVVVELVASSEGLGYLIVYGRQLFQLDLVMAAVVVVGAIGYAIDRALDWTETKLIRGPAAQAAGRRDERRPALSRDAAEAAAAQPLPVSAAGRWRGLVLPWPPCCCGGCCPMPAWSIRRCWCRPKVLATAVEQISGGKLWRALGASLAREFTGFAIGTSPACCWARRWACRASSTAWPGPASTPSSRSRCSPGSR